MSGNYKFTFKKDDVFVEFDTTDKEALARQFQIWVTCASVYTYQHKRLNEQENDLEIQQKQPVQSQPTPEPIVMPIEETVNLNSENKITLNDLQNDTTVDFDNIKTDEEFLAERKQAINETVEKAGVIGNHLDNLYNTEQKTLNSLETFKEKIEDDNEFSNKSTDFDKILELSMNSEPTETEVKKDDRFLKILNVKNVSTKLEYLIVTAYYLSEFEKMDKFTLKLINAKLMQNIREAVDHNVLHDAIDKGLVEVLPSLPDIANSVEYRLTNAGEEAFLNGTKL